MRTFALSVLLAAAWLAGATLGAAESGRAPPACTEVQTCGNPNCCAHCGCCCECVKYCCIQPTIREIKKIVWACHCEDFCAPLPGCKRDCCCQGAAGEKPCCDKCNPCAVELNKCQVPPKCGKVRERKILERKEIICQVPTYKCVVVYCCPNCHHAVECGDRAPAPPSRVSPPPPSLPQPTAPLPPPPPPDRPT
jgi:hypothetical protein